MSLLRKKQISYEENLNHPEKNPISRIINCVFFTRMLMDASAKHVCMSVREGVMQIYAEFRAVML